MKHNRFLNMRLPIQFDGALGSNNVWLTFPGNRRNNIWFAGGYHSVHAPPIQADFPLLSLGKRERERLEALLQNTPQIAIPLCHGAGGGIPRTTMPSSFPAFSTAVSPAKFNHGRLVTESTGGTSLDCVVAHIRKTQPAKALIITDGYVAKPESGWCETLKRHGVEFLISAEGTGDVVAPLGRPPCTPCPTGQ